MSDQTPQLDPAEPPPGAPALTDEKSAKKIPTMKQRLATGAGAVVGIALVTLAFNAYRASAAEDRYIASLGQHVDFDVTGNEHNRGIALDLGHRICDTVGDPNGDTVGMINAMSSLEDISSKDGALIVGYALKYLCPGAGLNNG